MMTAHCGVFPQSEALELYFFAVFSYAKALISQKIM